MTERADTSPLTAAAAEGFVRDWHTALAAGGPVTDLMPRLANGLRLELPAQVVRGHDEFVCWHATGRHLPVVDPRLPTARLDVRLTSPLHAEVSCLLPAEDEHAALRHTWSLVLQDGAPRLRTVTVHVLADSRARTAAEPAAAEPVLAGA